MPRKRKLPEDEAIKLDTITLMRLRTLDAEVNSLLAQIRALSIEIDVEISKQPVLKQLVAARTALNISLVEKRGHLKGVHGEIEEKYQINLNTCSVDDETGLVHQHPVESPAPVQVDPPKRAGRKKTA